jgi:hypothetical protein
MDRQPMSGTSACAHHIPCTTTIYDWLNSRLSPERAFSVAWNEVGNLYMDLLAFVFVAVAVKGTQLMTWYSKHCIEWLLETDTHVIVNNCQFCQG